MIPSGNTSLSGPSKDSPLVLWSAKGRSCVLCRKTIQPRVPYHVNPQETETCLPCAGLSHLAFLPSGDVALTRRSQKHDPGFIPVVEWNRRRKRYERRGLLGDAAALDRAHQECTEDAALREVRREKESVKRAVVDKEYIADFAAAIRELYPRCPKDREHAIAAHACEKHSGRVGRSSRAKEFSEKAINQAVVAHIRHLETDYDDKLRDGVKRTAAREQISPRIQAVLASWR